MAWCISWSQCWIHIVWYPYHDVLSLFEYNILSLSCCGLCRQQAQLSPGNIICRMGCKTLLTHSFQSLWNKTVIIFVQFYAISCHPLNSYVCIANCMLSVLVSHTLDECLFNLFCFTTSMWVMKPWWSYNSFTHPTVSQQDQKGWGLWVIFTVWAMLCMVYAMVMCLSVSVCVCPSQACIVSKRLHIGSHKQRRPGTHFLMSKIFSKFKRGHPQRGRQMQVG